MHSMNGSNEQLSQLAIAAQQCPPCSHGRQVALRQLVNGILRSGKLCHPQRGQFPGRYQEIHDEAVQNLLLYLCQNIDKYNSEKASLMGWVNMLLERRFFREAIPDVIGKPTVQRITLEDMAGLASPQESLTVTDMLKECIESDPENLFKNEHLEGCPAAHFQVLALKRLEGLSWQVIATEYSTKTGTISSFYSRCLKKFSAKLRAYCIERGD